MTKAGPSDAEQAERKAREQRLAKALRDNLRRRKALTQPPGQPPDKPGG